MRVDISHQENVMNLHGKIITLEGPNASGKETQAKMLKKHLTGLGFKVHLLHYPEYESSTGQLIKQYLNGDFGDKENLFEFAAFLYAADRARNQVKYHKWLADGDVIIHDRYMESNWAIQTALFDDPEIQEQKLQWLRSLEQFAVPSDLVFYLDVPGAISLKLMEARGGMDQHELDVLFVYAVEARYQELSRRFGWHRIQCTDRAGTGLLPKEEIHQNILTLL
jgi:dTMP kinase